MGLTSRFVPFLLTATLAACGGGGGGGGEPDGGDPSAGRFTLVTQSISATATQGSGISGGASATGTVTGASDVVYVYVDLSASTLVAGSSIYIEGDMGTLELWGVSPDGLSLGTHSETVPVRVCADAGCNRHLAGSPANLTFNYEILPNPAETDSDGDGVNDQFDAFPHDGSETADYDQDNIGDNADMDNDNDGIDDDQDDHPLDGQISSDTTLVHFDISGEGFVTVDGIPVDCSTTCSAVHSNADSSTMTIEVTTAEHYSIGDWTTNLSCDTTGENTCTIYTPHLKELTVDLEFIEDPYALVVIESEGGGVVEKLGQLSCHGQCEIKAYTDTSASFTLQPIPAPGYDFSGWSGACEGAEDCEITVNFGESVSVDASFEDTGLTTDLCVGTAVTSGSGTDFLGATGAYLPLCHGQVLLADTQQNKVIWRDVVNSITVDEYQLSAVPRYLALDEENKLLFVTHGTASKISRVDLATGEIVEIFIEGGADSLAISPSSDLIVRSDPLQLLDSRYGSGLSDLEVNVWGNNISYNDATNRLITSTTNYFFDTETKTFTEQGPSNAGGSGSDCNYVVVSPDGEHGAKPCGGGNGAGYTIFDFSAHDPTVIYGEWATGPYPSGAAFSPSSEYAWLTNRDELQLFSVDTHALLMDYAAPHCGYSDTRRLAVSTDGSVLLALTVCGFDYDSAIMSWIYYDTNTVP